MKSRKTAIAALVLLVLIQLLLLSVGWGFPPVIARQVGGRTAAGIMLLLTAGFCYAVLAAQGEKLPRRTLILANLVVLLSAAATPAIWSQYLYAYPLRGRIMAVYGENPYVTPMGRYLGDPFGAYCMPWSRPWVERFGPLWTLINVSAASVWPSSFGGTLLVYKLIALLVHGALLMLVLRTTSLAAPGAERKALLLYAWNPVVINELVLEAHNDGLMMLFGVLAFYALMRQRWAASMTLLVLGGLVKPPLWILIPIFCVELKRRSPRWRRDAAAGLFAGGLAAVLTFACFYTGPEYFLGLKQQADFTVFSPIWESLPLLAGRAVLVLDGFFGGSLNEIPSFLAACLWIGRLLFCVICLRLALSRGPLALRCASALAWLALLCPAVVSPWYAVWWLVFLALERKEEQCVFWTLSMLVAHLFFGSVSGALLAVGAAYLVVSALHRGRALSSLFGAPPGAAALQ